MSQQFYQDTVAQFVADLRRNGVVIEVKHGRLRWSARRRSLTCCDVARLVADQAALAIAAINPDATLPDVLVIPRETANDIASLTACIDAQRLGERLVTLDQAAAVLAIKLLSACVRTKKRSAVKESLSQPEFCSTADCRGNMRAMNSKRFETAALLKHN
jgi:hypothetical protein